MTHTTECKTTEIAPYDRDGMLVAREGMSLDQARALTVAVTTEVDAYWLGWWGAVWQDYDGRSLATSNAVYASRTGALEAGCAALLLRS